MRPAARPRTYPADRSGLRLDLWPDLRRACGVALFATSAAASDLKLDGQVAPTVPLGATLQVELTGGPGLPALLVVDADPGPVLVAGEPVPVGLSPASVFLPGGVTDAAGHFATAVPVPPLTGLVGTTWHLAGALLDPADPNGLDVSNAASVTLGPVGLGVVEVQLAGRPLGQRPFFEHVRAVNEGAPVSVALDPLAHPGLVGKTVDLHVVAARDVAGWAADPTLVDLTSGGADAVTIGAGGLVANTFPVDAGTLSAAAGDGLGAGYDVVVDVDRDGTLSAGDLVDGHGDEAGLYVVHDTTLPGPYAVTEVLYSGGTWLDQDLYYPSNVAGLGRLPLVVVSHGNGHNYQWYDHIGYHLASYGFVVMSHSNNTTAGIDAASISTLDNTDALLGNLGVVAGGVLDGHVDDGRIMWIGHSRGGEGVVRAYDRLVDGTYVPQNFAKEDVRLISSMAPTAYLDPDVSNPHDASYHLWVGQSDNDVSGCPVDESRQSFHLLDRATAQSQSFSIQGVGHAWFHAGGGYPYASGPCQLGEATSHLLVKGYLLPLAMYHLRDNVPAKDFLTRQYESFRPLGVSTTDPCIVANLQFQEAPGPGLLVLDDFQTNPAPALASSGASVTYTVTDVTEGRMDDATPDLNHDASDPWNGFTQAHPQDATKGLVFSYDGVDAHLTYDLGVGLGDWTGFDVLSFRACQGTRHPLTVATLADQVFEVELEDGAGSLSVLSVDAFGGGIEEPYQRITCGHLGTGWSTEFETVRLPLAGFTVDDAAFDLADVRRLTFRFGPSHGTPEGRLGLDDVQLAVD